MSTVLKKKEKRKEKNQILKQPSNWPHYSVVFYSSACPSLIPLWFRRLLHHPAGCPHPRSKRAKKACEALLNGEITHSLFCIYKQLNCFFVCWETRQAGFKVKNKPAQKLFTPKYVLFSPALPLWKWLKNKIISTEWGS